MTWARRRAGSAVAALAVAVLSALAVPTPTASATTYYEYWSYWHKPPGATSWQYSSVGASGYYLKTGKQVEGWRYALGTASPSDPQPRPTDVTYDAYCAGKNTDKAYQVLLVVDYGTTSSAPSSPVYSCYGFSDSTTGYAVLTQQHTERDSGGLICAIDNYPRSGCGDTVSSPAPKHTTHTSKPASPGASTTRTAPRATTATASAPRAAQAAKATTRPTATAGTTPPTSTSATSSATPSAQPTLRPFTGSPTASRSSFPFGLVLAIAAVVALSAAAATRRWRRG